MRNSPCFSHLVNRGTTRLIEAKLEGTSGGENELWNATYRHIAVHEAPERPRYVLLSKVAWPQTQSTGAELILRGLDLSLDSDIKKDEQVKNASWT